MVFIPKRPLNRTRSMMPGPGEKPVVILRLQVLGGKNLLAQDRNGFSDPFVVVSLLNKRAQTPVAKRTLNPVYAARDATFDLPIYLSLAEKLGALELVIWDKDTLSNDYMGEVALTLEEWFPNQRSGGGHGPCSFNDPENKPFSVDVVSTRSGTPSTGTIEIKLGFVEVPNEVSTLNFDEIFADLVQRSEPSFLSAAPTRGVGTIRSNQSGAAYEDDGGISSEDENNDEEVPTLKHVAPHTNSPRAPFRRLRLKHPSSTQGKSQSSADIQGYNFTAENDIVGIVMLEVQSATNLPKLKNATRTGWDMDPFVVVSFGKKVFRTRVIRHSRNPVWDEKLLFHVRRHETKFNIQISVLDWDKLSSNDNIGDATIDVQGLLNSVPQKDPTTGLYAADEDGKHAMRPYNLQLAISKDIEKDIPVGKELNPVINIRAKYQPYDALRQQFWRQYLLQYDTDETRTMSRVELTSMLDSLGSTLSHVTIDSFFTRHNKSPHEDELTIEEAVQCLEEEIRRPDSEKRRIDATAELSGNATPVLSLTGKHGENLKLGDLDFAGPSVSTGSQAMDEKGESRALQQEAPSPFGTEPSTQPLVDAAEASAPSVSEDPFERVVSVKNCPLCHRPRMDDKAEIDIITHMAVCASEDWGKVGRIVVSNFVTASQAQRKWYTNILSKVSSGEYQLGANSANIIVQNRLSGQLEEEKMQVYVRLGIRLLYKGNESRMEGAKARKLLKSLSIKQGVKYDSPASALEIPSFIAFHNLVIDEIQDPLDSFKTFNEFFYRKLKATARPVESPDDPYRLVSGADCRMMAFETVSEATRLWIKGREFTVARLLGDVYRGDVDKYTGGALAIFRLAPQDYHRFHSPVDGTIGKMTYISGEYYTVNPQAIRTALDVYGENVRKIVPIDSPQFGRVFAVCVGAMMVGSIATTVQEGDRVKRGQEFGYFAFGGSTIVLLFESGAVKWDEDLLINGQASLETLVRVGMGIGNGLRATPT